MSFNRENVIWKSPDGAWNRGFFTAHTQSWKEDDDDYDPEWDVDYDYDEFEWFSGGHPSEEAAHASWKGANPGSCSINSDPSSNEAKDLERLAANYRKWEKSRGSQ